MSIVTYYHDILHYQYYRTALALLVILDGRPVVPRRVFQLSETASCHPSSKDLRKGSDEWIYNSGAAGQSHCSLKQSSHSLQL